jgi:hypothetical protein
MKASARVSCLPLFSQKSNLIRTAQHRTVQNSAAKHSDAALALQVFVFYLCPRMLGGQF